MPVTMENQELECTDIVLHLNLALETVVRDMFTVCIVATKPAPHSAQASSSSSSATAAGGGVELHSSASSSSLPEPVQAMDTSLTDDVNDVVDAVVNSKGIYYRPIIS